MPSTTFLLERNKKLLARVRELETLVQQRNDTLQEKDSQLLEQSVELAMLAPSHSLTKTMYEFIKKVAVSKSKFAKEAKELL